MKAFFLATTLFLGVLSSMSWAFVPRQQLNARSLQQQEKRTQGHVKMILPGNALASLGLLLTTSTGLYTPTPSAASFLEAPTTQGTQVMLSKDTEVRSGMYKDYEVEKAAQKYENAEGTFKTKEATDTNKNKYVAILTVLLIGSAVIPMVQYWFYVKEE